VLPSGVHVRYEAVVPDDLEDEEEAWVDTGDAWAEQDDDG
jgi:hypothetical protein